MKNYSRLTSHELVVGNQSRITYTIIDHIRFVYEYDKVWATEPTQPDLFQTVHKNQ